MKKFVLTILCAVVTFSLTVPIHSQVIHTLTIYAAVCRGNPSNAGNWTTYTYYPILSWLVEKRHDYTRSGLQTCHYSNSVESNCVATWDSNTINNRTLVVVTHYDRSGKVVQVDPPMVVVNIVGVYKC